MRAWKDVATLVKTKNLKGRFVVRPAANLPFLLEEGMRVAFVPPQTDVPREAVVDFVAEQGDGAFEVGFDAIGDKVCASKLVGCHCLVKRSELAWDELEGAPETWAGWVVVDEGGLLVGEVNEFVDKPGQALLSVERADGNGEVYLPVADELILSVDAGERRIVMEIPVGLLDL